MGALPVGIAGFGTREAAAVVVLGALGIASEQALAVGLLYGVAGVLQGVLVAPAYLATLTWSGAGGRG
jgi:glycosyltransferase 2 family protein